MHPLARLPYLLAGQLANLASLIAPPDRNKLWRSLALRRGATDRIVAWARSHRDASRPLIWIHAPSVGEGLMAAPVIERLRRGRPSAQILYTYFSPSAETFAATLPVDFAGVLPFDTGGAAVTLLDAVRPGAIVFSKLDVWPLLTEAAAARGIPTALISATVAPTSGRRSPVARLLLADAYAALAAIGAVHDDDARRLAELGARRERITVTGDTRYDQVWARIQSPRANADLVARLRSDRPTLVAGSTWPADERQLIEAFEQVRRRHADLRLLLAPHEPDDNVRMQWEAAAEEANWSFAPLDFAESSTDIIWVDRMGVLADLYALATAAFVGGGFHDRGLHSVIEPAAHGAPVLFGPEHRESRDAIALVDAGGAFAVANGRDFADRLTRLLLDPATRAAAGEKARGVVAAGLGAADRSAALVEQLLAR